MYSRLAAKQALQAACHSGTLMLVICGFAQPLACLVQINVTTPFFRTLNLKKWCMNAAPQVSSSEPQMICGRRLGGGCLDACQFLCMILTAFEFFTYDDQAKGSAL